MDQIDHAIPLYRISGFTTSNKDIDQYGWFRLDFWCNGNLFSVTVSSKDIRDSPAREREFQEVLGTLLSEQGSISPVNDELLCEDLEEDVNDCEQPHADGSSKSMGIGYCFDWVFNPCAVEIEHVAPRLPIEQGGKITLDYFYGKKRFSGRIKIVQERFIPEFRIDTGEYEDPDAYSDDFEFWKSKTTFPVFSTSEIEVLSTDNQQDPPYMDDPSRVRVKDVTLFFKKMDDDAEDLVQKEVDKYEKIKAADFASDVRTSRLQGIVEDGSERIVGLLYDDLGEAMPLDFEEVISQETPLALRQKWANQIQHTVEMLHKAGVVWGDAKAGNILVDGHGRGDAWVIDFGGGFTKGWVDREKSDTVEGDLQGLANILIFLETGNHVNQYHQDSDQPFQ
ncbi:hypothetical protein N0V93_009857 [Gnomoniopsis smithogilvyi]|uniref:Protein kinase domain-containing protein n=1 Tax=Gnomoniopsis smithogilvyi TaxID=1191159 RepID=A0A9W8YIK8_9PEZI|nr:hypothetical protein N0V93_009857 [Gnomoniopsis smithogilvyi]